MAWILLITLLGCPASKEVVDTKFRGDLDELCKIITEVRADPDIDPDHRKKTMHSRLLAHDPGKKATKLLIHMRDYKDFIGRVEEAGYPGYRCTAMEEMNRQK